METNNTKKKYMQEHKNIIKEIAKENQKKFINTDADEESELDKKISQYGILGKNLKNLSLSQKEKFVSFIDREISIKKKISENYNTEYFVEQERLALQRKLKYEVLIEIETLTKIANIWSRDDEVNSNNESTYQKNNSTVILGDKNNFVTKKIHDSYISDFEEKRNKIWKRIEDIKNEHKQKS